MVREVRGERLEVVSGEERRGEERRGEERRNGAPTHLTELHVPQSFIRGFSSIHTAVLLRGISHAFRQHSDNQYCF